jgi:hypothetical protein
MSEALMLELIEDAVGEQEADRLIVCELGSISEAYNHLISIGSIEDI